MGSTQNYDAANNATIKCKPYWTAATGSGTVIWGFAGRAFSEGDPLDADLATGEQTITDTITTLDDLHIGDQTAAITLNGTPAKFDWVQIRITRDASVDTSTADASFMGFMLEFTIDNPNAVG